LWLKHCVVPTLPHEVIAADVVYPAVLLAHGKSISLLPVMLADIQSGLRVLTKSLCQVEAITDSQGRPVVDSEGRPEVKTPNPRVGLPYTYLIAWYVMHCPSLMMRCLPQKASSLLCRGWRIRVGHSTICAMSEKLCSVARIISLIDASLRFQAHPMGISLPTLQDRMISPGYRLESFGGSSTFDPDIWSSGKVIHVRSSLTC